ncbi:hypothetical protein NWP21_00770 [Anabaenopsis sp. FSS-46]|uniref:hypothetical protein n=1 Tax=Anabaenopsis sp. FSS-46 TaxID=2971766 RepID=UPI002475FD27|nr:hypothetical protein [Anabaenopsis sp. FSS-46]MDH6097400.1 hypothetical protein [Anabaenopsis sp. FSS-46]
MAVGKFMQKRSPLGHPWSVRGVDSDSVALAIPSTVNKTAIALSSRVINYPSDSESPLEVDYEVK